MRLFQATCFRCRPAGFLSFSCLSIIVGALTGFVLGLPVLRLRGDYLAIVTLGFAEVVRALVNNLDKPVNFTNGPRGISADQQAAAILSASCWNFSACQVPEAKLYPLYFYFLILLAGLPSSFWSPGSWKTRASGAPGKRSVKTRLPPRPWAFRWCA